MYASKISLASRVVKVERQVDDIERKLDTLIDLYMQDRKHLSHSLPIMQPPKPISNHSKQQNSELPLSLTTTTHHDGTVGTMAVQSTMQSNDCAAAQQNTKPKPILIEKQFSEPNSPIVKTFDQPIKELHTIYRGYSDLGNRIKTKRVTLR